MKSKKNLSYIDKSNLERQKKLNLSLDSKDYNSIFEEE